MKNPVGSFLFAVPEASEASMSKCEASMSKCEEALIFAGQQRPSFQRAGPKWQAEVIEEECMEG